MKKVILLFCIAILFLFCASSFAQVGLSIKGQGTYGILLKPDIQETGLPEEKLTKGGFGFSGQLLYRTGKILSLGVEAGFLPLWKWEFTLEIVEFVNGTPEIVDAKFETSYSAVPILGVIQLEAPLPLVSPYLQIGPGFYPLTQTIKVTVPGTEEIKDKDTETKFGIMFAAGVAIPFAPKLNLDVGGKLHMIFTEGESTIMLNPVVGILIRF